MIILKIYAKNLQEKKILQMKKKFFYKGRKLNLKKRFNNQIQKEDIKKNKITILCIKKIK